MFHVAHGSTNDNRNVKQKHKHSNGIHENSEKDCSHPTVSLLKIPKKIRSTILRIDSDLLIETRELFVIGLKMLVRVIDIICSTHFPNTVH